MMSDIVVLARSWIGTPYHHQAAIKGAGCDCLGLIRGVWAEYSGTQIVPIGPYSADWSEPQRAEVLWQAAATHLTPKTLQDERPGDVLLFRMRDGSVAKHLGIVSEAGQQGGFIHSFSGHGVVESRLTDPWRRRIVARFEFPEKDR